MYIHAYVSICICVIISIRVHRSTFEKDDSRYTTITGRSISNTNSHNDVHILTDSTSLSNNNMNSTANPLEVGNNGTIGGVASSTGSGNALEPQPPPLQPHHHHHHHQQQHGIEEEDEIIHI